MARKNREWGKLGSLDTWIAPTGPTIFAPVWGAIGSGYEDFGYDYNTQGFDAETTALLNSLTPAERDAAFQSFYNEANSYRNLWGLAGMNRYELDANSLNAAIANMSGYAKELAALGKAPIMSDYLADARNQIAEQNAAEFAEMDKLLGQQRDLYNAELKGLGDSYDLARSNLLSQQYQQNSQLMDTLQSGMERSRRNALEAGASAGIRIADNINTLLSVQNKQSATSMETANQLSQMMINQRNAEAATRRDYSSYLQADSAKRSDLRLSADDRAGSLANTNYTSDYNSYNAKKADIESKYDTTNPLYGRSEQLSKYYMK